MPLRYKVLVRGMKIVNVLYNAAGNIEEVPFEEVRITPGKLMVFDNPEMGGECLANITNIPISMIACHPSDRHYADKLDQGQIANYPVGMCTQRSFERLPGLVDVEMIATNNCQNFLDQPWKVAQCICEFRDTTPFENALVESRREQEKVNS